MGHRTFAFHLSLTALQQQQQSKNLDACGEVDTVGFGPSIPRLAAAADSSHLDLPPRASDAFSPTSAALGERLIPKRRQLKRSPCPFPPQRPIRYGTCFFPLHFCLLASPPSNSFRIAPVSAAVFGSRRRQTAAAARPERESTRRACPTHSPASRRAGVRVRYLAPVSPPLTAWAITCPSRLNPVFLFTGSSIRVEASSSCQRCPTRRLSWTC